jgi:hypothetical protein
MLDVHLMIPTRQILGFRFFNGDVDEAVAFMHGHGGYLVALFGDVFYTAARGRTLSARDAFSRPRNR